MKLLRKLQSVVLLSLLFMTASCRNEMPLDSVLYSEVKSVKKIVLAQMSVSKMATVRDLPLNEAKGTKQTIAALTDAVKIGDRVAVYSYNTYLRAYMSFADFSLGDLHVDDYAKTITIELPEIDVEFQGRDMEVREEHYRVTGLRSQINAVERAKLKEAMNVSLKEEVENNREFKRRLVEKAKEKAEDYFSTLLARDGYTVIVNFKYD